MVPQLDFHAHRRVDPLLTGRAAEIVDITCTCPRSPCGPERHASRYELVFVRAGVFVKHNGRSCQRELAAQPAHVLFLHPGETYCISHPSSQGDACTVITYAADVVHSIASTCTPQAPVSDGRVFPAPYAVLAPTAVLRLQQLRLRLRAGVMNAAEAELEALTLLRTVLEDAWAQHQCDRRGVRRSSRRRREMTETVKQALARRPAAATSLSDLATYVGISPFYLARTFRHEAGITIHQYLLRLRLGMALDRMTDTSLRLGAIALDAGFSSPSHFTTAFRKAFGVTPAEWRAAAVPRRPLRTAGPTLATADTDINQRPCTQCA